MQSTAFAVIDDANQGAWQTTSSVRSFARLEGWSDPGERAALESIAPEVKGQPILDLGVGAGRTVPMLRTLSSDYMAIAYTPGLVTAVRRKYPNVCVLKGDARDLACLAPNTFKLVVFGFNGIDAIDVADRDKVLREVYRVLQLGGIFLFSARNKNGPGHSEHLKLRMAPSQSALTLLERTLRAVKEAPRTIRNYRHTLLNEAYGRSITNATANDRGLLSHYITLEKQCEELERADFLPDPSVYANFDGRRVESGDDTSRAWWLHYIARKG